MHASQPCVLLFSENSNVVLPFFEPREHHFGVVGHINRLVEDTLGITATVLRCVSRKYDSIENRVDAVYIIENHSPEWLPPENGIWVDAFSIQHLHFKIPDHQDIIQKWFKHGIDDISISRRPWSKSGWFKTAENWITNQLEESGIEGPVSVNQVRTWERSCILKVISNSNSFYFKAVPGRLAHEVPVSLMMRDKFTFNTIEIIASDNNRHWLLMNEAKGTMLRQVEEESRWAEALSKYARIQAGTTDSISELSSNGCPDFSPVKMINYLEDLLDDTNAMLLGFPAGLSQDEYDTLRSLVPSMIDQLNIISEFSIPNTLVHGDFWSGNIICSDSDYIFFDWSDSTISHPFFDLPFFFGVEELPFNVSTCNFLLSRYLEQWTDYENMDQLRSLYSNIQRLGWIHKAIIEHRLILRGIEESARWEFENTIPYYLKRAIIEFTGNSI